MVRQGPVLGDVLFYLQVIPAGTTGVRGISWSFRWLIDCSHCRDRGALPRVPHLLHVEHESSWINRVHSLEHTITPRRTWNPQGSTEYILWNTQLLHVEHESSWIDRVHSLEHTITPRRTWNPQGSTEYILWNTHLLHVEHESSWVDRVHSLKHTF